MAWDLPVSWKWLSIEKCKWDHPFYTPPSNNLRVRLYKLT